MSKYSVKGLPCILSAIGGDVVILPALSTDWIINQPDDILDAKQAQIDTLQADYTFRDKVIVHQPHHEHVIKTDLLRQLGNLTMDIMDELTAGFDETWGFDTEEWKSVCVFENMRAIIARTSNRIFVGLPLCLCLSLCAQPIRMANHVLSGRNTTYLSLAQKYSQDIPFAALIIRQLPHALRPVLAPFVTLPNKYHVRQIRQHLDPIIETRLTELDPEKGGFKAKPNDFLQWSINNAQTRLSDKPEEMSPHILAGRLLVMNFAAIHTSTFAITNLIFDLVSAAPSLHYLEELREEAASIFAEDKGVWTKRGLSKMYKIDSALRESLRLRSFASVGMVRRVVAEAGVDTPEGIHLPYGALVGLPSYGIHIDANNYADPDVYNAMRYVNQKALIDTSGGGEGIYLKKANLSMVSTSTEYQAFGHGRHACPGRFFAANELKLLLAYMVLNYDIEPLTERPSGRWMVNVSLPDMKASIKVRRRK
jgi:cytochrome P450